MSTAVAATPLPAWWPAKPGAVFKDREGTRGILTELGYVHWASGETSLPEELEYDVLDGYTELVLA